MSASPVSSPMPAMSSHAAVAMFLAFAFAYFFSALLRAVTATLAPEFSADLGLSAGDLGLLAGAYFFGFSMMQLPLGTALDRWGPRRVLMAFLSLAVLACAWFAMARGFASLLVARALIGVGASACLMAPLTAYRLRLTTAAQLRANSWMLMTGSLGMVASTLPVQWLLPVMGWRGLFWALAALIALATVLVAIFVPHDVASSVAKPAGAVTIPVRYAEIFGHAYFVRLAPLAFFVYGGLIAIQSLWAGPWLTAVSGWSADEAAGGLFAINLSMLFTFFGWGLAMPHLNRVGLKVDRLIALALPASLLILWGAVSFGGVAGAAWWAIWCVSSSVVSLSQPALAQVFPPSAAGRALTAFNLVIFLGVFSVQWGIGLMIDALSRMGLPPVGAIRTAFGCFAGACVLAYIWFLWQGRRSLPLAR